MGCLKRIFSLIILIFAYIGFQSIGGIKYFQDLWTDFTAPPPQKTILTANKIIDTSNLSNDFEISRAVDFFGMSVIDVSYQKSPQKIFLIDSKGMIKLTKEDFKSGKINETLQNLVSKFAYQAIRIENLHIIRNGSFVAMNNKTIPFVLFEADIIRGTAPKMYGMLGIIDSPDSENDLILSFTTVGKYNQSVTEKFFKQVSYSKEP